jgi:hypothetical protein
MKNLLIILLGTTFGWAFGQQSFTFRNSFTTFFEFPMGGHPDYVSGDGSVKLDGFTTIIQGFFFPTSGNVDSIDTIFVSKYFEMGILYDYRQDSLDAKSIRWGEDCVLLFCLEALYQMPTGRYWRSVHQKEPLQCADFEMEMRCIPLGMREVTLLNLGAKREKDRFCKRQVMVMCITDITKIAPIFRSLEHGECTY